MNKELIGYLFDLSYAVSFCAIWQLVSFYLVKHRSKKINESIRKYIKIENVTPETYEEAPDNLNDW